VWRDSARFSPASSSDAVKQGGCGGSPECWGLQGFDEFMNLVIDDAFEVKLAKKDAPEERRKLGERENLYIISIESTHAVG
jgi:hypothetical protein